MRYIQIWCSKYRVAIKKKNSKILHMNTPSGKLFKNVHFGVSRLIPDIPFQSKVIGQKYYALPSKAIDLYISFIFANAGTTFRGMDLSCVCFGWDPNGNENVCLTMPRNVSLFSRFPVGNHSRRRDFYSGLRCSREIPLKWNTLSSVL